MRAGVDAAGRGELGTEIAGVRLVRGRLFLLDLDLRRHAFLLRFNLDLDLLDHLQRMHVDVAVGTQFRAFAAANAPVFNNDFEVFLPANRADRALRHAKRIAAGTAGRRHQVVLVAEAVAQQSRNAIMRLCTGAHTGVAARAIIQVDEEKILRLE